MGSVCITHNIVVLLVFCLCAVVCTVRVDGGKNVPPPARKKVAVEGVVYCKVCGRDPNNSFHHVSTLSPLAGAVVKVQCNNTRKSWEEVMKTEEEGEFLLKTDKVTSWGVHKCKLFLVSSPRSDCIAPTDNTPYFDNTPWKFGFALTKSNNTTTHDDDHGQYYYYTSVRPLLYYSYWPDCM